MSVSTRLSETPFDPAVELAKFNTGRQDDGAVVTFVGLTRGAGGEISRLTLDWYPGMTERSIQSIAVAARERFDVSEILVIHRCGTLEPGEPIVMVAVASEHRREAFQCADHVMDCLKSEAAFWKCEERNGVARWVEPSQRDRADLARWR